jgi:endogenous inhibitor of DNA gyrase (YacG/DUF329 family)
MVGCGMGVIVSYPKTYKCIRCGKEKNNISRTYNPKYCSRRCQANVSIEKARIILICEHCKKEFIRRRGERSIKNPLHFCSRECLSKYRVGPKHPSYKDGLHRTQKGYITIQVNGKRVLRNRYVMSNFLGRPLLRCEEVHHRDGQKENDNIENLEIWDHSHPSGQRLEEKILWAISFLEHNGYSCVLNAGAGAAHEKGLRHVA